MKTDNSQIVLKMSKKGRKIKNISSNVLVWCLRQVIKSLAIVYKRKRENTQWKRKKKRNRDTESTLHHTHHKITGQTKQEQNHK